MHRQADVSQGVLHFGTVVKAESPDQLVAQSAAAKNLLERARLEIGAIFHCTGLRGVVVEQAFQLASNKFRLGLGVARLEIPQVAARSLGGAEGFAKTIRVVLNHGTRRVENILGGAVVAFEANDVRGREVAGETQQNGDIRSTPPVNGLIFIADHADVLPGARKKAKQLVLDTVGVLIFVDVDVLEFSLPFFTHRRGFAQEAGATQQQIIEVK